MYRLCGKENRFFGRSDDQTGQTCGTVVVSQADSGTNGKQPCHVIDQSAACLDQQEADG